MITRVAESATIFDIFEWARERGKEPAPLTLDETIAYAHALAQAGIYVVVLPPGLKRPEGDYRTRDQKLEDGVAKKGWYLGTTDPARLTDYITRANARHNGRVPNLGMQLGTSRLIVVDADNEGDEIAWNRYAIQSRGDDSSWATVRSPGEKDDQGNWKHRDGVHFYFRVPDDIDPFELTTWNETVALGHLDEDGGDSRAGWDVKGASSGVALPLSERPEGRYLVNSPHIPVAPEWLIAALTKKATAEPYEFGDQTLNVDEILDIPWAEFLCPPLYDDGAAKCGCRIYRRPGGSPKSCVAHEGCSDAHGSTVLTIHSDTILAMFPSLAELVSQRGSRNVTKWEALAAFRYDGDLHTAAVAHQFGAVTHESVVVPIPGTPFTMSIPSNVEEV